MCMRPRSTKSRNNRPREYPYDAVLVALLLASLIAFALAYGPSPLWGVPGSDLQAEAMNRLTHTRIKLCEDHQPTGSLCRMAQGSS